MAIVILTILKEGKNKMTMYLKDQIRELSRLILKTQEIKGYNISNSIHTTAQMHEHDYLDNHLLLLVDDLKKLRDNLLKEQALMQSNLWQTQCYLHDALKQNNKLMKLDKEGKVKSA